MRKTFLFITLIGILVLSAWTSAGSAQAAGLITYRGGLYVWGKGIVFVFDAEGVRNRDVKGADIFVGSNFHDLGCTANKEEAKIVCVLRGGLTQHAGETGVIYLGGQIFYVTIPAMVFVEEEEWEEEEELEELVCEEPEVPGASVRFQAAEGEPQTFFFAGDSLEEVESAAIDFMDSSGGFFSDPEILDEEITCGVPDEFEVPA